MIANVAIKDNNISTNASDLDIDSDMLKKRKCRKEETVITFVSGVVVCACV